MFNSTPICCEICHRTPMQGIAIYRTGKKGPGEDPHWQCTECSPLMKVDTGVAVLAAVIEKGDRLEH
jgi:hypothetical protein